MKHIWKAAVVFSAAMMFASCNDKKFTVEGQIGNGKDAAFNAELTESQENTDHPNTEIDDLGE